MNQYEDYQNRIIRGYYKLTGCSTKDLATHFEITEYQARKIITETIKPESPNIAEDEPKSKNTIPSYWAFPGYTKNGNVQKVKDATRIFANCRLIHIMSKA